MVEIVGPAARSAPATRPDEVSVDGVIIPRTAIAREIQNHAAPTPAQAWHSAARALVVRELLLARAERLGLAAEPRTDADGCRETEEEALIRALLEAEVKVPTADTAACRRYFEHNRARFRTGDLFEVSHILIPARPQDAAARRAARAEAEAVLRLLHAGANFEDLAREHSACPSREVGGSLGQIGRGQTVPEFDAAMAALEPGTVSAAPVETRFGFHILRLAHKVEGQELPFETAEPAIAAHLEVSAWHVAVRQYLSLLAGAADIRGVALDGAASPLVQ